MRPFDFLLKALDRLSLDEKTALRLRYIEKLPSKEVAKRLGRTDGATRVLLTRAKQKLMATGLNVEALRTDAADSAPDSIHS